jgi:hypothetical protein
MQPICVDVADAAQLERVVSEVVRMKADALIVRDDPMFSANRAVSPRQPVVEVEMRRCTRKTFKTSDR